LLQANQPGLTGVMVLAVVAGCCYGGSQQVDEGEE